VIARLAPLLLLALLAATAARAQSIVLALSQSDVSITATFAGSRILVFGAIRNPPGGDTPIDVVVTVAGPLAPVTVRRKERVGGIWVNVEAAEIDAAPSFYAVATTEPLEEALTRTEDLRHAVSVPRAIRAVGSGAEEPQAFVEALIRIREEDGHYGVAEGAVTLRERALFRTEIALPPDLVEGDYTARAFLTREGRVLAVQSATLAVRKVGLERFLYRLAHDSPPVYGLASLLIAAAAGWGASAAFRALRA
jgi:uncharacterized protein (TIGR02186 family)